MTLGQYLPQVNAVTAAAILPAGGGAGGPGGLSFLEKCELLRRWGWRYGSFDVHKLMDRNVRSGAGVAGRGNPAGR